MNTYENAPATTLIAVCCACCARPLLDAKSVETGMGPHCRAKHGYRSPDVEKNDAAIAMLLGRSVALVGLLARAEGDVRRAANLIVHRIAAEQTGADVLVLTDALEALGFVKLSARISDRLATVRISEKDGELLVETPYSEESLVILRGVPGRRWDRDAKANRFPVASKPSLFGALKRAFPGAVALGPKGLFQLAAA